LSFLLAYGTIGLNSQSTEKPGPLLVADVTGFFLLKGGPRMALIKFGGGITEMRGSIAGNVFSRNRYGAYVRARTKPINPNTSRQQAVRASVAELTVRWSSTLTAVQRTAWNLYASSVPMLNKLGETIYLSGFNHFVRSNVALTRGGLTNIDAGPVIFELPPHDPALAFTSSEATGQLSVAFDDGFAWCSEDDAYMEIYVGKPQNAQRNFFGGPWRICGMFVGDSVTPLTSPHDVGAQYTVSEGQHVWIYARIRRADGRLSEPFRADTFCSS